MESGLHKDLPLPGGAEPLTASDPRSIGAYTIIGRLGAGGMGAVYLGRGPDGALVAVKVIRDGLGVDPGFRARFEREVESAKRVASFCTAAVLDHGVFEGQPYLITEYIEGPTLLAQVLERGPLAAGTLQGFAVGVAMALNAIHGAGLVHRDLKPSNVILSVSGPRVIDFGIARAQDGGTDFTRTGQLIGSPGWIAPEQLLADRATTAVDIYTWGCLVAFAARARHPFGSGEPIALASRVLHGEPELDGVPEPLLGLVRAAMNKDPAQRPTAQQLLMALTGGGSAQTLDVQATRVVEQNWQAAPPGPQTLPPTVPTPPGAQTPGYQPPGFQHTQPPHPVPAVTPPPGFQPTQPPQGAPRRQGGRRTVYALSGVLAALLVATGVVFAFELGGKGVPDKGKATNPLDAQNFKPLQLTGDTGVGRGVVDAGVEFTLGRPRCGGASYRGMAAEDGVKLCLLPLTVRNPSPQSKSDRIYLTRQSLVTDKGTPVQTTEYNGGFLNSAPSLPPGGQIAGELLFEVPDGARPVSVKLYGSDASQGVEVKL